jgi:hypothetical protein
MKKNILGLLLWTISISAIGQENIPLGKYDLGIKLGILLGTNLTITSSGKPGISCGIALDYRLSRKLLLQPNIMFSFLDNNNANKATEQTVLEIPLHLLIRPFETKFRPTLAVGPNYKFDFTPYSLGWFGDIAIGLECPLKYFNVVPELRYSYSKTMQTLYFVIYLK